MELLIENVLNIGSDEFYRASRYGMPLVVVLVNTEDKEAFDIFDENTRQTDIVQQLSSELLVVFLSHTNYQDSILFLEKMKDKLTFTHTSKEFVKSKEEFIKSIFLENEKTYN